MSQQLPQNTKWNDNRRTDAFKSTRKMYRNNRNGVINTKPANTSIWRDNVSPRTNNSRAFENKNKNKSNNFASKQWTRDSPKQTNVDISEQPIFRSKWTAERSEKDERDSIFQRKNIINSQDNKRNSLKQPNVDISERPVFRSKWTAERPEKDERDSIFNSQDGRNSNVPEKKSFNKKIVIIERKTRRQLEAEKKAIYDSFIKESFILKVADHLGNKKSIVETVCSDSWDIGNETCVDATEEYLDDFDKWERSLLKYVDDDSDDFEISKKRRKSFFTGLCKSVYDHYKLQDYDNENNKNTSERDKLLKIEYMKKHKRRLKHSLRGLSVLPTIMIEDTQENIEEAYESLYEFMISKRMKVHDISFEYDINHLLEINDKELRKEFNKMRKKYNSIKKTQKKLENKERVQKAEQYKYNSRHECVFLYHRLRYYDKYYMDGKLKFINNTNELNN